MFGGSGKLGRGAGGSAAGKRNIHAPPLGRPSSAAPNSRFSMSGGARGRGSVSSAPVSVPSTSSLQVDESFSLVRGNPLNFAMSIRLAPDLVEEIKRVESLGGTARIKFDANPNNLNGNVINVADKNFKFTWSRETEELCDVYEECQNGEDGNGLLVESGCAWRKLNLERVLDESTKNHVKMRSEEAERKHKSRKAIVLDHQNPSMKNQMKAFAASESNQWRNFSKRKEPPFKKPKSEPPPAAGPPKSVFKSGLSATPPSKGKLFSGASLSSQPEHYGVPASPVGRGNSVKGHGSVIDVAAPQNTNRSTSSEKEKHGMLLSSISHKSKHSQNSEVKPADLKSLMISLLREHQSSGMSLKALEKAIGDTMPNSVRQMEPILKQIAVFHAPGRYSLKPGLETENFKKPHSENGSSPVVHHQSPELLKFDRPPQEDSSFCKTSAPNEEEHTLLNSTPGHVSDTIEKIDILHNSPDHLSDRKVSDNGEKLGCRSSDSGSESNRESDSSDSGSDSGSPSRSKSQSPAGSQSGSSSDSESEESSSSKQASDEDVDIMKSDDDEASKPKLRNREPAPLKSPIQWRHPDDESVDIGTCEKQHEHVSGAVEIGKDSRKANYQAERGVANYSFPNKIGEPFEEIRSSTNQPAHQQNQVDRESYRGPDRGVHDFSKHHPPSSHEKMSEGKSKIRSDDKNSDERPPSSKRLKSKNLSQPVYGTLNLLFGESPSPDRSLHGLGKEPIDQLGSKNTKDSSNPSLQMGFNQGSLTRPFPDAQQSGPRSFEANAQVEALPGEKRVGKQDSLGHVVKNPERDLQTSEGLQIQKGSNIEPPNEDGFVTDRRPSKSSMDDIRNKYPAPLESHYRSHEVRVAVNEAVPHPNSCAYSPKHNNNSNVERSPMMNGRLLRREHSDLELGEFRETPHAENSEAKRQFEKKGYFKQLENGQPDSERLNSDSVRGKPCSNIYSDARTPNSEGNISGVPDRPSKRKVAEHSGDDGSKLHSKATRPLPHQLQPRADQAEVGSQQRVSEMSGKSICAETGSGQGPILDTHGDGSKKGPNNQQYEPIREVGLNSVRESKKQKPIKMADANGKRKYLPLTASNDGQKRREFSSDENSCYYFKYEKEEPELKGPIKDTTQYKEYVKEYEEKYESYCSLRKILQSYRDEFSNLGKDLEIYKNTDVKKYNDVIGQIMSSYRRCGERHKRLKKIFVVLYEELKHLKQMMIHFASTFQKD